MRRCSPLILLLVVCLAEARADSPRRIPVSFQYTWDVGFGRSLFVVGNHPDLGAWDPLRAVKLYPTSANTWTGQVAVQAGTALEYKFVARTNSPGAYCDPANVEWMSGPNLATNVPADPPAPYTGKTILYHSGWTNAFILYRDGTNWVNTEMSREGPGRGPGEFRYRSDGIGRAGEPVEFVPHGYLAGTQYWDNTTDAEFNNNYFTSLDAFFLQDGRIFNYWPPDSVSVSRILITNVVSSWDPPIISRDVRIYLPRGYEQNTWKRYPVLYMHDGQNIFEPGGAFGTWSAEVTANRETDHGRMRECIIVGVDNTADRLAEYTPPGDTADGNAGIGDRYADFLIHNVRPTIDFHFRTLTDRNNTLTMGSSMGGLISAYLGFETNVFGAIGIMSPSFWTASNFVGRVDSNNVKGIQVYLDWGSAEGSSMWDIPWHFYDLLLEDGYAPNDDLLQVIGCGDEHNEAAWAARLPGAYRFLLNPLDEPNLLAQKLRPPIIGLAGATGGTVRISTPTQKAFAYDLERSETLSDAPWSNIMGSPAETMPWSTVTLSDTNPPAGKSFYRVSSEPSP